MANVIKPLVTTELLGQTIKAKRTQSRITQADAAALCNISKQTYIKIEQGKGDIRMSSIIDVMKGLGINISITPWTYISKDMNNTGSDDNDNWV